MSCACADTAATVSAVVARRVVLNFISYSQLSSRFAITASCHGRKRRSLLVIAPRKGANAHDLYRVQRTAIARQPADFDLLARLQAALIGRVACFDDEIIFASDTQAGSEHITHVDEFLDLGLQRMGAFTQLVRIHLNPFGADGNRRPD